MLSKLNFQSKLNKFNSISESPPSTAISSTTTTPTSLIPGSQNINSNIKLGLFQLNKTLTTTTPATPFNNNNNNNSSNTANTQVTSNDNNNINTTTASQQPTGKKNI